MAVPPPSSPPAANALGELAFDGKDMLIVVDDYAPRGNAGDRQRLEGKADFVFRAQGNRSGRGRAERHGGLQTPRPPRGLILSTGEEAPPGSSLRGRVLAPEVSRGDVPLAALTSHQRAAAAGRFAQALAGFVRWLAPRYGGLAARLSSDRDELRDRARTEGHPRTAGIVADLMLGFRLFLDFALAVGALPREGRAGLARRSWETPNAINPFRARARGGSKSARTGGGDG
jgi:hypothetical protein